MSGYIRFGIFRYLLHEFIQVLLDYLEPLRNCSFQRTL